MGGISVYGGDPRIAVERDELQRISALLRSAADQLGTAAWRARPELVIGLIPNLVPQLQVAVEAPAICQRLTELAVRLDAAAEGYFSLETQNARAIRATLVEPLLAFGQLTGLAALAPLAAGVGATLAGAATGMGLAGVAMLPSPQGAALTSLAAAVTPAIGGKNSVSGLLGSWQKTLEFIGLPTEGIGSAAVAAGSETRVLPANSLAQHAARLNASYFAPDVSATPAAAAKASTVGSGRAAAKTSAGSSIRIEVYPAEQGRQLVVYVPGTQSAKLGGKNPLDMKSNLNAMAGPRLAASEQAVRSALATLGAGAGDRVIFVGHSQGALISANIAADRQANPFKVNGLILVGGPIAHLAPSLAGVPTIAIEHTNDPVPGLSGTTNPLTADFATVQREAVAETVQQAHGMGQYLKTAELADTSQNLGLVRLTKLLELPETEGVEYRFELSREN